MDYYEILGITLACFIVIAGFFVSIKKSVNDDKKPLDELNANIIKLNTNFENMLTSNAVRDKRIEKHGMEIDSIVEKQRENEKTLSNHEIRLGAVEKRLDD